MNNVKLLEEKISESGYKKKYLAKQLGITYAGFQRKITNNSTFTSTEISDLCKLLKVRSLREKEDIFFDKEVDNTSTKEDKPT